ncbi:unnamed protein product [Schistosoma bovis]|uniref:Profilin n=1 Tax=Schistosoma bovis TaxID=6184 RepID=A0A430Q977_SCHBO|nr:uncharacterized protein DC041_0001157 [Schistosoma bovis]CAH8652350.1 unnamed protein product [Schistosoma bovis]CAH8657837.1 unnamed protein product [Schistosoma bovis]
MSEEWKKRCENHVDEHKSLKHLHITDHQGTPYGSSSPDFQLSPEFVLQLKSLLTDEKDTSFTFMNEKYIIIRRDPTSFISRCLKKSILFHITPKLCLVGQTVDDNLNNCNPGNHAMSCICDYYKKYNY